MRMGTSWDLLGGSVSGTFEEGEGQGRETRIEQKFIKPSKQSFILYGLVTLTLLDRC